MEKVYLTAKDLDYVRLSHWWSYYGLEMSLNLLPAKYRMTDWEFMIIQMINELFN